MVPTPLLGLAWALAFRAAQSPLPWIIGVPAVTAFHVVRYVAVLLLTPSPFRLGRAP